MDKFLLPVLPITASRGCAWAKCKFCVHHQTYSGYYEQTASDAVDNIENLVQEFGVHHYHFTDDMLDVPLGTAIAEELIKRQIDVNILTYARFDKRFNEDILKTWQRGGISVIEWGLESASPDLLKSMSKGITITQVQKILNQSREVGILNKLMLFHNYPGETVDDFEKSIKFVEHNVENQIIRPFFTIRNKLELRRESALDHLSQASDQNLFPKIWTPSSVFQGKIEYEDAEDYGHKVDILDSFLERMQKLTTEREVFSTNDENLTLDLIVWEMETKDLAPKIHCM